MLRVPSIMHLGRTNLRFSIFLLFWLFGAVLSLATILNLCALGRVQLQLVTSFSIDARLTPRPQLGMVQTSRGRHCMDSPCPKWQFYVQTTGRIYVCNTRGATCRAKYRVAIASKDQQQQQQQKQFFENRKPGEVENGLVFFKFS